MINQHEFRRNNPPAAGESETEYFVRISKKFNKMQKAHERKQFIQAVTARLRALITSPAFSSPLLTKRA